MRTLRISDLRYASSATKKPLPLRLIGLAANPSSNQDQETAAVDVRKHDQHEASTQTEEITNGSTYQQGYQKALEECTLQTQTLLNVELKHTMNKRIRANAVIDEFYHRSYDHDTRVVVKQLLSVNAKTVNLKMLLKNPQIKGTRTKCLMILQDAEVDIGLYTKLHEPNRQVVIKQCRAINAKLADLKTLINQSEQPDKVKLLKEMYRARGDEQIEWNDDDPLSDPRATRTMPKYEIPVSDENGCPRVGM